MNEGMLQELYDFLVAHQNIDAVMAKVQDFISPDCLEPATEVVKVEPYYGLFTGAVLMRRKIFDLIGPFSENIHTGEIIEWQNKMTQNHLQIEKMDVVATRRRIHDHNFGKTHRATEFQNYAQILRQRIKKV